MSLLKLCVIIFCSIYSLYGANSETKDIQKISLTQQEQDFIQKHKTITLGCDKDWEPSVILNKDGTVSGYDNDVLKLINSMTGANFQLTLGKWDTLQEQAKQYKIDGLSSGIVHESRKKYLNFSAPYLTFKTLLIVSSFGNQTLTDLNGKKFAIQKGNIYEKSIAQKYKNAKIIEFNNPKEMIEALVVGDVDVIIGKPNVFYTANKFGMPYLKIFKEVENNLSLCFGVRKDYPEAISIINKALEAIPEKRLLGLQNQWFLSFRNDQDTLNKEKIPLSKEEVEWLHKNHKVRIRIDNIFPYQIVKDGKYSGISVEIIEKIFKQYGIRYEFLYGEGYSFEETLKQLKNKDKIDMLLTVNPTKEREKNALFSDVYLDVPFVIFTRNEHKFITNISDLDGQTVAVEDGYIVHNILKEQYPNIKLISVFGKNQTQEALKLLATGKVEAYIGNLTVGSYTAKYFGYNNIKVAAPTPFENNKNTFGVRDDWPQLKSIINKGIANLGQSEIDEIKNRYFVIKQETNFEYFFEWLIIIVSIAMVLIVLILAINKHLKNRLANELKKNQQQQLLVLHQNRLAQMGEYLNIIIHQLREPLNALHIMNQTISLKYKKELLDNTIMNQFKNDSKEQIKLMESTIEEFRDFFNQDRDKEIFYLEESIHTTLNILKAILVKEKIDINVVSEKKTQILGYKNKFIQVLLNIINNSKDAFQDKTIEDKQITIEISENQSNNIISIFDNAGGIPENIISKIFEPYFSTKKISSGTGLGLYIVKLIIEDYFKGSIEAINFRYYQNDQYNLGAKFIITIPKS